MRLVGCRKAWAGCTACSNGAVGICVCVLWVYACAGTSDEDCCNDTGKEVCNVDGNQQCKVQAATCMSRTVYGRTRGLLAPVQCSSAAV